MQTFKYKLDQDILPFDDKTHLLILSSQTFSSSTVTLCNWNKSIVYLIVVENKTN